MEASVLQTLYWSVPHVWTAAAERPSHLSVGVAARSFDRKKILVHFIHQGLSTSEWGALCVASAASWPRSQAAAGRDRRTTGRRVRGTTGRSCPCNALGFALFQRAQKYG